MSFFRIAAIGLAAVTIPTLVQAQDKPVLGSYTCYRQRVPCDAFSVSSEYWAAYGNLCLKEGFSYANPEGYFDDVVGLTDGCLTAIPGRIPKGLGAQLTPHCCVVETKAADHCVMHCNLVVE